MDPIADPNPNGQKPDPEVVNLDDLVAKPQKVILAGEEFELPVISTRQLALFMRAQKALQGMVDSADPDQQLDVLVEACGEMDALFPQIAERTAFADLSPLQLERVMRLVIGLVQSATGGKAPNREQRRRRPAKGRQRQRA